MTGKFFKSFGQGILRVPWGIAVTEDNVFVTDVGLNALLQFNKIGYKLVRRTDTKGAGEGELNYPIGVITDSNGDVCVNEYGNNRISVFSKDFDFLKHLGTQQLKSPRDVKVTPNNVVVSGAIPQKPILGSLHSRVYSTFRQLAPPLSEGARAQIMTRGPLALSTALPASMTLI